MTEKKLSIKKNDNIADLAALFEVYNQATGKREPVRLSPSQEEIFRAITTRDYPRYHVMTTTQYGKSFTVALAVLVRAATFPEKWAIIAPSEKQAKIIMGYIIEHIFDHPLIKDQFIQTEKDERLKAEKSKKRITFRRGGEIFILSADTKNKKAAGEALMGFGAANIILDESSLIPDDIYAKIFRMLGGHADNFILEIGNPFKRNHFLKSFRNDRYRKIIVDYKRAIEEGRLTPSFVEEMKERQHFDVLYGVKFPEEEDVDATGWMRIFYESAIYAAKKKQRPPVFGKRVMGVDVNRGGDNKSVIVIRWGNHAEVVAKFNSSNLNELAALMMEKGREHGVAAEDMYIDATGVGGGLYDIMTSKGWYVNGINMASKAIRDDKYINRRAEAYMLAAEWLKKGNTLCDDPEWNQLEDIKAQVRDSSGKWQVISKQKLAEEGIPSPDIADAFMLTFCAGDLDEYELFKSNKKLEKKRLARPIYE